MIYNYFRRDFYSRNPCTALFERQNIGFQENRQFLAENGTK
jgi:hypothetical protein